MISIGDRVVYRHHVCEVASIRENYYEGKDYLELRALFENSLKLFVALDEAKPPALRPIMTEEEAHALIARIGVPNDVSDASGNQSDKSSASANLSATMLDRQIKEEYDKRMKSFSPEELLPIMQCAYERSMQRTGQGRNATAMDMKYFNLALSLLCDELSISLGIERDQINDYLDSQIKEHLDPAAETPQILRGSMLHHR